MQCRLAPSTRQRHRFPEATFAARWFERQRGALSDPVPRGRLRAIVSPAAARGQFMSVRVVALASIAGSLCLSSLAKADDAPATPAAGVSYYKEIRPIFQANCQGCHQPAKAGGEYVMTTFDRLLKGGESSEAAIVFGKPDESHLLKEITPTDGKAEMPKEKPPLADVEIQLIRKWISEGAKDDTPANAVQRYDAEHPPVYSRLPVVTAIDFSPDGQLIAIAGFHEVL